MSKTNFDRYLEEQLQDPAFTERFKRAGEPWDVALQIAALREKAGLSLKDFARKLKTSQQNISRLLTDVRELILRAREGVARAVDSGLTTLHWHVRRRIRQGILKDKRADYGRQIVFALGGQLM
ncbi:MAG: helix-turn-helix domain-containing protein [Verrucomicrobiota bacterium]